MEQIPKLPKMRGKKYPSKDIVHKEQIELNNTTTKMKNTLEGISGRITEAEEWISELEDRMVEITAVEQNKEKR